MFGYITINKPEVKVKEFERYHAYYCGLCRDLRALYGPAGQATLSYDLTFVAVLLTSLYEPKQKAKITRCILHPAAGHPMLRNEYTAYAAKMNLLMAYHKAEDDALDEGSAKGKAAETLLRRHYRKIVKEYPEKCEHIREQLDAIHALEKEDCADVDAAAGAFGEIMAEVLTMRKDQWQPYLHRLGFYLGKFVYLMDAFDDIEKDLEKGNYNPLKNIWNTDKERFEERCRNLLTLMMEQAARAFEALPLLRDAELLRNILYSGVWVRFAQKAKKVV
ncbi:MAG: hypothetical protein IK016_07575 [Lachnospiraceae bacterium]|nr:hypothetical protein [Lachnospiraceae bacterium]